MRVSTHRIQGKVNDMVMSEFRFDNRQYLSVVQDNLVSIYEIDAQGCNVKLNRKIQVKNALKCEWTKLVNGKELYLIIGTQFGQIYLIRLTCEKDQSAFNLEKNEARHTGKICVLKYFQRGPFHYLVSASEDKSIRLWHINPEEHRLQQISILLNCSYPPIQCLSADICQKCPESKVKFVGCFSNSTVKLFDLDTILDTFEREKER